VSKNISAYLTIYNDWDLLELALQSMEPVIDELVVVDGAYEWMAPYYRSLGFSPERSGSRLYDVLESSRIPYKTISRVWSGQAEKRIAGYQACSHRYACRMDADEVMFFDERALTKFIDGGGAVAEVEMPTYICPGWISTTAADSGGNAGALPRQAYLFDREQIEADIHLNYLWSSLWLTADKAPRAGQKPFSVSRTPIGYNAHLTLWRSADNAARRAGYYMLNYMRQFGVPWIPQLRGQPVEDFKTLFDLVPPDAFSEIMLASRLGPRMKPNEVVTATPLTGAQEATFAGAYLDKLASFATLNSRIAESGLRFTPRARIVIDISDDTCLAPLTSDDVLLFEFSDAVQKAKASLFSLLAGSPREVVSELDVTVEGKCVAVRLPPSGAEKQHALSRQVELRLPKASPRLVQHFRIQRERPLPFTAALRP